MKEQIVTFETAKLAKEKGFNYPTNLYYQHALTEQVHEEDGTSGPFGWELGETSLQSGYHVNNRKEIDFSNNAWYLCSAPTQSLLQKWLREIYKIDIYIRFWNGSKITYEYVFRYIDSNKKSNTIFSDYRYDNYEEALEKGLQEALKLINP